MQNGDPRCPLEVPHKTLTDGWDVNILSDTTQGFQDSAVTGLRVQQRHERLDTVRKRAVPGDEGSQPARADTSGKHQVFTCGTWLRHRKISPREQEPCPRAGFL